MMVGEIDYGDIIVDARGELNENTGAPFVPIPEFSAVNLFLFLYDGVCFTYEPVGKLSWYSEPYMFLIPPSFPAEPDSGVQIIESLSRNKGDKLQKITLCEECTQSHEHKQIFPVNSTPEKLGYT